MITAACSSIFLPFQKGNASSQLILPLEEEKDPLLP
jgi:hypothetical protein